MAGEIASAYVRIRPNMTGFKGDTERGVRGAFAGIGKLAGEAFAGFAAFETGKKIIDAAKEQQVELSRVQSVVKATGAVWKIHGKTVFDTLDKIARDTGFQVSDLAQAFTRIQAGTKNTAISFATLSAAENVARARGMGVAQASQIVSRAVQGNVGGLGRLGVVFDKTTTTMLKHLVLTNKTAAAHFILGKLQERFGGQAKAFADTAAGGIARFHESMRQLEVSLGKGLLPVIGAVAGKLAEWMTSLNESERFHEVMHQIGEVIREVAGRVQELVEKYWPQMRAALLVLMTDIGNVVAYVRTNWPQISAAFAQAWSIIQPVLRQTISLIQGVVTIVRGVINVIVGLIHGDWSQVWKGMGQIVGGAVTVVKNWLGILLNVLKADVALVGAVALRIGQSIWNGIKAGIGDLGAFLRSKFQAAWAFLKGAVGSAEAFAHSVGVAIVHGLVAGLSGLAHTLEDKLLGPLRSAWKKVNIFHISHSPSGLYKEVGKSIMDGMTAGIVGGTPAMVGSLTSAVQDAINQAKVSVEDAISQAKQSLAGIAGGIGGQVGQMIDARTGRRINALQAGLQREQNAQQLAQLNSDIAAAKRTLANLHVTAGSRPQDYKTQILAAQKDLAAKEQALHDYHVNQRISRLQKEADAHKAFAARRLADLSAEFSKGLISQRTYIADVRRLLAREGINYKTAGRTLGLAFATGFQENVKGLNTQAGAIRAVGDRANGISGLAPAIVRPLDAIHAAQKSIHDAEAQAERAAQAERKKQTSAALRTAHNTGGILGALEKGLIGGNSAARNARR